MSFVSRHISKLAITVIVAVVAFLAVFLVPNTAFAATVTSGGSMTCAGATVPYYSVDGNMAYKADANYGNPSVGNYQSVSLSVSDDVKAIMWFGYGGPGFDQSMWPATSFDGRAMTATDYAFST